MKEAVIVSQDDIKQMLADKFGVPIKNVIRSQYSYTVITESEDKDDENN